MVHCGCRIAGIRSTSGGVCKRITDTEIVPVFLSEDIDYRKRKSLVATANAAITFSTGYGGISVTAAYNRVKFKIYVSKKSKMMLKMADCMPKCRNMRFF